MSNVTYDGKYIVPVQDVSINTSKVRAGDNSVINTLYSININGTLIAHKGSPTTSGTFGNLDDTYCENIPQSGWTGALMSKRCALEGLFENDYRELVIGDVGGTNKLRCFPRLLSIDINDTSNPQVARFSVQLEADSVYCNNTVPQTGSCNVRSFSEDWEITYDEDQPTTQYGDNRLFRVTHTVSAQGVPQAISGVIEKSALSCAKDYVCSLIGIDQSTPQTCIDNYDCSNRYNYFESHSIDEANATYSVTESWVCTSSNYTESYTIQEQYSNTESCPVITIDGEIIGYETRVSGQVSSGNSKYDRALSYYNSLSASSGILSRAETDSGYTLDPTPLSKSVSKAPYGGTISYSESYRKMPARYLSSAKYEEISLSNNWDQDISAVITILGKGDKIQKINTNAGASKVNTTTLNIEAYYECDHTIGALGPRFSSPYAAEIQSVVDIYHPSGLSGVGTVVVDSQQENWDRLNGTYSYNVTWSWDNDGVC